MKELAVITFTGDDREEWLEAATESIKSQLPESSEHLILKCRSKEEIFQLRWECLSLAKYIAFVDNDDLIINDSISKCFNAIKKCDCGLAFTDEQIIEADGSIRFPRQRPRDRVSYLNIASAPNGAHHLCIIKTDAVPRSLADENRHCIEWLIKASAGLTQGAVRIKEYGYQWRKHDNQVHTTPFFLDNYASNLKRAREVLLSYSRVSLNSQVPIA